MLESNLGAGPRFQPSRDLAHLLFKGRDALLHQSNLTIYLRIPPTFVFQSSTVTQLPFYQRISPPAFQHLTTTDSIHALIMDPIFQHDQTVVVSDGNLSPVILIPTHSPNPCFRLSSFQKSSPHLHLLNPELWKLGYTNRATPYLVPL